MKMSEPNMGRNIGDNQLETLPKELENLSSLHELWVSENKFKELPKVIAKLTKLNELWLQNNHQIIRPNEICSLVNLTRLLLTNDKSFLTDRQNEWLEELESKQCYIQYCIY